MNAANISKAILSISSPGTCLWDDAAKCASLSRDVNSYAAGLQAAHPDRFGFWATLPLPYVNESIAEIDAALDEGAEGFVWMTNYRGYYLGDPIFDEVLNVLNERNATIFFHPTTPYTACRYGAGCDWSGIQAAPLADTFPSPLFEFFFDTARLMTNMLLRGVYSRFPCITTIFAHAGGAFPPLLTRVLQFGKLLQTSLPDGVVVIDEGEAREILETRCYFDLAGWPFPGELPAMMRATGVAEDRLLYGSDFPFFPEPLVVNLTKIMDDGLVTTIGPEAVALVHRINAERLLGASNGA
ncbi:uncharacterized protein E0L32_004536 [Thyridium curvatum]|uniref:6-methylsalicylate decarboxylase n=1 Tax=Thyridium curvatum TaxID=1093900 RepID=A0A507BCX6_9PEZI|nr:uncharacterized protein E0L32_004536 [Thyridium curvatum]TPX15259.1 hypothetical protein E0L32_004536 [Thyridium curvatum]